MSYAALPEFARKIDIQLEQFGQSITYTPLGGAGVAKTLIVHEASVREGLNPGRVTRAFGRSTDFPALAKNDEIQADSVVYRVQDFTRDRQGGLDILLRTR